ncbi:hypothetical protein ACIHCV_37865 [Streptomyces sp. NPDC051956]|uniref:hypothetical protein n=1 Tax=Streptomyces sp. NPDC051956 TaxID=3365677 RepID=UPI0037D5585F
MRHFGSLMPAAPFLSAASRASTRFWCARIGVPGAVVAVVSVGYGLGTVVFPLLKAAVSEICPKEQLAGMLGVFLAVMSSGGIVGPYLAGRTVDTVDSPASGYALAFQVLGPSRSSERSRHCSRSTRPATPSASSPAGTALDLAPGGKV